jgi:hypothetical protein
MEKQIYFLLIFFLAHLYVSGQGDNCTDPKVINVVCPNVVELPAESTAGFTNDRTTWGSFTGNGKDIVYEVNVPAGSKYILVSMKNISNYCYLVSTNNLCSGNSTYYQLIYPYTNRDNIAIPITGTGPYYIWVDPYYATDMTYSITFGVIETSTYVSIPNTKGDWGFNTIYPSTCPGITLSKQGAVAEIFWNGIHQNIVTYSPLNVEGVVTCKIVLKNQTGVEGVKKFTFTFDPDLTNISPTSTSIPGFYNAGNWVSTTIGKVITWTFNDAAGTAWGDFDGVSNNCLVYTFSFNITPISNLPSQTNIITKIFSDGKGAPFNGYINTGCCASLTNCSAGGSSSGAGGTSIGFGFNDPASLPVKLISFKASAEDAHAVLHWQTASEHNSDRFEVELSEDGITYKTIGSIFSAGESSLPLSYGFVDPSSNKNHICYYRLKLVDIDGSFSYSQVISLLPDQLFISIYPNPVNGKLNVESLKPVKQGVLYDQMGKSVLKIGPGIAGKNSYDLSEFKPGIYFLLLEVEGQSITQRIEIN